MFIIKQHDDWHVIDFWLLLTELCYVGMELYEAWASVALNKGD